MLVKLLLINSLLISFSFAEVPSCQQLGHKIYADSPFSKTVKGKEEIAYYKRQISDSIHNDWPKFKSGKLILASLQSPVEMHFKYGEKKEKFKLAKSEAGTFIISPFPLQILLEEVPFGQSFILELSELNRNILCQEKILYIKAEV
jgi:hypothetical protein